MPSAMQYVSLDLLLSDTWSVPDTPYGITTQGASLFHLEFDAMSLAVLISVAWIT